MSRFFETVIRVPMPDGALAWGKVAASIEPAFEALAKGLAKAGVEGVEIVQREVTKRAPRQASVAEIAHEIAASVETHTTVASSVLRAVLEGTDDE